MLLEFSKNIFNLSAKFFGRNWLLISSTCSRNFKDTSKIQGKERNEKESKTGKHGKVRIKKRKKERKINI